MPTETPMDREAADRIAAADRDPQSPTATSGFDERADAAASRNEQHEPDQRDQDRKE